MGSNIRGLTTAGAAAALGVALIAPAAFAADPVAPMTAGAPSWEGFYAGVNVAVTLQNTKFSIADDTGDNSLGWDGTGGKGLSGGIMLGYDKMIAPRWIAGLEIDLSALDSGSKASIFASDGNGGYDYKFKDWNRADWGGALRGRLGYLVSPETMFYVASGVSIAHVRYGYETGENNAIIASEEDGDTYTGVLFTGIGAETRVSSNMRFRYEYISSFLQSVDVGDIGGATVTVKPMGGTAMLGWIYDFNSGHPGSGQSFGYAPQTWTGFYVGGNFGQTVGSTKYDYASGGDSINFEGYGSDGVNGGIVAGYNFQLAPQIVVGLEANYSATNLESRIWYEESGDTIETAFRTRDTYGVRGRFGFLPSPGTMIFGTVGWTRGDSETVVSENGNSQTNSKWTADGLEVGGGIETWIARNISVRADYNYVFVSPLDVNGYDSSEGTLTGNFGVATLGAVFHLN